MLASLVRCCFVLCVCSSAIVFAQPESELSHNVELLSSFVPKGLQHGFNDVWGYELNGREYAVLGGQEGVFIIDVTAPRQPFEVERYLGEVTTWRDMKTFENYLYVVLDKGIVSTRGEVWVIDLSLVGTQSQSLVRRVELPTTDGYIHNCYVDEDAAVLWLIGVADSESSAIAMDLRTPAKPQFIGEVGDFYWHDAYARYPYMYGCAFFEGELQILNIENVRDPKLVSKTAYTPEASHAVWLSDDGKTLVTADERRDGFVTLWNVEDIEAPEVTSRYFIGTNCVPHNVMFSDSILYISGYYDGLKVLDISDIYNPVEIARYDTYPDDNYTRSGEWNGAWGIYSMLPSGNILVSDKTYGLFVFDVSPVAETVYVHATVKDPSEAPLSQASLGTTGHNGIGQAVKKTNTRGIVVSRMLVGETTLHFQHEKYQDVELPINLSANQDTVFVEVVMPAHGSNVLNVQVVNELGMPLEEVFVSIEDVENEQTIQLLTDADGTVEMMLSDGLYHVYTQNNCDFVSDTTAIVLSELTDDRTTITISSETSCYEVFESKTHRRWSYSPFSQKDADHWIVWFARDAEDLGVISEGSVGGEYYDNEKVLYGQVASGNLILQSPELSGQPSPYASIRFKYLFLRPTPEVSFKVQASTDGAETWQTVWEGSTTASTTLQQVEVELTPAITSTRSTFRFICTDPRPAPAELIPFPYTHAVVVLDDIEITHAYSAYGAEADSPLRVSPNPTSDVATINVIDSSIAVEHIFVCDVNGVKVLKDNDLRVNSPSSNIWQITTKSLANGIYYVVVYSAGNAYSVPFTVQR